MMHSLGVFFWLVTHSSFFKHAMNCVTTSLHDLPIVLSSFVQVICLVVSMLQSVSDEVVATMQIDQDFYWDLCLVL